MPFKADKSNVPREALSWSLFKAAREFGIAETTLGQRLAESGEVCGPDECFATKQLLRAVYGEVYRERLRKTKEEADLTALKVAVMRGDYISRVELENGLSQVTQGIVQAIKGSHLSKEEQDDLRRQISSIPVVIKAVGDHQKNGSNGDTAPSEKNPAQE